jgi:hypothetical protein
MTTIPEIQQFRIIPLSAKTQDNPIPESAAELFLWGLFDISHMRR